MALHTEWVTYGDGQYIGYAARPARATGPLPAVIVIQEIWGVDEHIQDVTRRFAQAGYVAFAPDLYAKRGQRPEELSAERIERVKSFLDTLPPAAWHDASQREQALGALPPVERDQIQTTFTRLFGGLNMELYIDQVVATVRFLKNEYAPSRGRKVGSVGFCMGGALSGMLAGRAAPDLDAAVIFYGNAPQDADVARVGCPVQGFYGGLDPRITNQVPDLAERMKAHGKTFSYQVYEGAEHAFFNDTRRSYHPEASRDAFARTLAFFNEHLSQ
ncbi:MAG: dienelactone hydrolase family protein [Thermoflavifilum sp.]|nr:dienelactone hydrolase family protein [Thermoflavifilum sp.]MCL6515060.1 dienelactone hydrolase family protein [Alicyclobacillus sp.]